jgi:hypothetical protein
MKNFFNFKALVLSFVLAMICALPVSAQNSDDFFSVGDEYGGTRDAITYWTSANGITNNGIGQSEAPVGGGLFVLTAVGAVYAIAKRKRLLRNGINLIIVSFMLIGLNNCKKNIETINSTVSNSVYITLRVNDGSRVIVDPTNGGANDYAKVNFENGDIIYVGYNNACIGSLAYDAGQEKFGGNVAFVPQVGDEPLYFYFLGNKTPTITETTKYTVDIIDQTSKYPVISYNHSNEVYTGAGEYTATLFNYCSIMKFVTNDVADINSQVLCITGMNNTVTVDFNVNDITYGSKDDGLIKMPTSGSNVRWAIVLPQAALNEGAIGTIYTDNGIFRYRGSRPEIDEIKRNEYLKDGKSLALSAMGFSVSGTKKVFFSPGNLQATTTNMGESWTWYFAANQWACIGNNSANIKINGEGTVSENGTVDLFAWVGASNTTWSGDLGSTGNAAMHGITNTTTMGNASDYGNTISESLKSDWGETIDDGNVWRTLTKDEWTYVLSSRKSGSTVNGISNARVTYANITEPNVNGIILFPDGVTIEASEATWGTINSDSNPTRTLCTTAQWDALEAKGCVFLPEAGYRRYFGGKWEYVTGDYYWSSSYRGGNVEQATAKGLSTLTGETGFKRQRGCAVRLVRDVN